MSESSDPVSRWEKAVAAKVAAGQPRERAIAALVKQQPDLHRAYIVAHNARYGNNVVANEDGSFSPSRD